MMPDQERVRGTALWLHRTNVFRFFVCPECAFVSTDPVQLGEHIERHREVEEITRTSIPCPNGCGRNFRRSKGNKNGQPKVLKEHLPCCKGAAPIHNGHHHPLVPDFAPLLVMRVAGAVFRAAFRGQKGLQDEAGEWAFPSAETEELVLRRVRSGHGGYRLRVFGPFIVGPEKGTAGREQGGEASLEGDPSDLTLDYP